MVPLEIISTDWLYVVTTYVAESSIVSAPEGSSVTVNALLLTFFIRYTRPVHVDAAGRFIVMSAELLALTALLVMSSVDVAVIVVIEAANEPET